MKSFGSRPSSVRSVATSFAALLSACVLCAATGQAFAITYYVDNTNVAASDAGPGTIGTPYRTIGAALSQHGGPGNTVHVLAGTYREQVNIGVSGAPGSPCVIESASSAVVVDGADDFTSAGQWTLVSGDVWLASGVTWAPQQVFADGALLAASIASPALMPSGTFQYVAGTGLYVNAGGGNPAGHGALVGHRQYGFSAFGRSWVTVRGFTVVRAENKGIYFAASSNNIEVSDCRVSFGRAGGIQFNAVSASRIARNLSTQNGDHGLNLTAGTTGCTVEDNESSYNVYLPARQANGIDIYGSSGNVIQRNRFHHNQDTGLNLRVAANNNLCVNNLCWSNGDHGVDNLGSTGNQHINTVTWGNFRDGFSIEGNSTGTQLFNCIGVDNGLTTTEFNLWVDAGSQLGFVSNDNIFWNSNGQRSIKYGSTSYTSIGAYATASGQDSRSLQVDPKFVNAAAGNFHLLAGSRAIDSGNSGAPSWPALDADGLARSDDLTTANTGLGSIAYADRGAFEYVNIFVPAPPNAALTVTPAGGVGPLTVTANASGSTDDGTIVSYRFDFGDGTIVGPQPGATAAHTYAIGTWICSVLVTDNAGLTGTALRTVIVRPDAPPVVNAPAATTVNENVSMSFAVTASDPDGHPITALTADFSGLPAASGAKFTVNSSKTSGTFSWKPSFVQAGSWSVTFRATANGLQATDKTTVITVVNVNRPPVVSAPGTVKVVRGTVATVDVTASDPDGDAIASLTANFSGLPAGNNAVFVPGPGNTSGRFTWTTKSTDKGRFNVIFTATNALSASATSSIQVGNNAAAGTVAGDAEINAAPDHLSLSAPTPNPAGRRVALRLGLPQATSIEWSVIDVQGRELWRASETRAAGWSTIEWDGRTLTGHGVGAGIYLVRVRAGDGQTVVQRFAKL